MMDESTRLLTLQQQLEKEADGKIDFFGLSINETIRTCLINGLSKRADKIKAEFKVPDKRSVVIFLIFMQCIELKLVPGSGTSSFTR